MFSQVFVCPQGEGGPRTRGSTSGGGVCIQGGGGLRPTGGGYASRRDRINPQN